ncbi:HAD family hydrolase [Microbacterium lushaniae]|uniref:HAD family hydrolase n=1 Tax=Microbacterium lushaniae TaxID=2614639 RepID=A0A5J6L4G9_9MICO|nr:HAD family hydrolase [Microbacterium lushaniae]QEW03242.1 HAD family hydrolase [Microbacterium lushaniae]
MDASDRSTPLAVLFDIDGTLVDSNYLHVDAWSRAFREADHPVDTWRIHRAIGMDSGILLDELLGEQADAVGPAVKEAHARLYAAMSERLRVFDGAHELLQVLADRGHTIVLATSAPPEELEILLQVLDMGDTLDVVTSAQDAETAKPEPDILNVAVERAGVTPDRAVMVGDAVWDVQAAARAGVPCIGVLSGGTGRDDLRSAGAVAVYDDVAALLRELDASPLSGGQE